MEIGLPAASDPANPKPQTDPGHSPGVRPVVQQEQGLVQHPPAIEFCAKSAQEPKLHNLTAPKPSAEYVTAGAEISDGFQTWPRAFCGFGAAPGFASQA